MYWQDWYGKVWGFLCLLLVGIDGDGWVQMVMNGGIYDKVYVLLGLYIEDGKWLMLVNCFVGGGNFFICFGGVFLVENGWVKIVLLLVYKFFFVICYVVQFGLMLIENGVINW